MKPNSIFYVHHKARAFRFDSFMDRRGKITIVSLLALAALIIVVYLNQ